MDLRQRGLSPTPTCARFTAESIYKAAWRPRHACACLRVALFGGLMRYPPILLLALTAAASACLSPRIPKTIPCPGEGPCDPDCQPPTFRTAPATKYPPELLPQRARDRVIFTFVVDTLGLAEPATFTVLSSRYPAFTQAVKNTLASWRFTPGQCQGTKVRVKVKESVDFFPPVDFQDTVRTTLPNPALAAGGRATKGRDSSVRRRAGARS